MAHYFDTSALAKFVVPERESHALRAWWESQHGVPVACDLVLTELPRTVRRYAPAAFEQARELLDGIVVTTVTRAILDQAARLGPVMLGSLDAIHLAAALDLGDDLEGFVTYDDRLAAAAREHGARVVRPQ